MSNWFKLARKIGASSIQNKLKDTSNDEHKTDTEAIAAAASIPTEVTGKPTQMLALDCEMVGVGTKSRSALAQVCIVNFNEEIVYLKYVQTIEGVTDYRTHVSGITPNSLKNARNFKTVQKEVADMLDGRILIGHGLNSDFKALMLDHPRKQIRDTAKYPPLMRKTRTGKLRPRKLKTLAKYITGQHIQTGEHNPAEDAIAALRIYKHLRRHWELSIRKKSKPPLVPELESLENKTKPKRTKKENGGAASATASASAASGAQSGDPTIKERPVPQKRQRQQKQHNGSKPFKKRSKKMDSRMAVSSAETLLKQGMSWIKGN
eukprot:gb/GECG01001910.1/.p1 GENE.gb/GECG01001910.1/~~gb/GECG01001910.1/.p1  ORF type:complete len:320 (+),score=41.94 gb/GECG01001910.1/:1-960(+)